MPARTRWAIRVQSFHNANPRHAPAYFNLGLLYGFSDQPGKALEMYRRGLKIDPNDLSANQNYAFLLMRSRNYLRPSRHSRKSRRPIRLTSQI